MAYLFDGWSPEKIAFFEWYCLTDEERKARNLPLTQKEYCEKVDVGVNVYTLSRWVNSDEWKRAFDAMVKDHFRKDTLAVLRKLTEKAKTGSYQHVKLWMEMMGLTQNEQTININKKDAGKAPSEMSPSEIEAELDALLAKRSN